MQQNQLEYIAKTKMPYGKYKDILLINLPEYYVLWLKNNRLPQGKLGEAILLLYEIKLNGLEDLVRNLK